MIHHHDIQPSKPVAARTFWRRTVGALALCGLWAGAASAQETNANNETSEAGVETVVLSPFEVNAEDDTGYRASSVQSGTRLRTDLRDVASSISVVTEAFMDDIAANDLESLLIYTLGTEVGGSSGNFADAGVIDNPNGQEINYDEAFASALPSTRVRGLTRADVSRDFFISSAPMDSYNVDRVEISRGANAMLFGLGSPAGIINSSLTQANLNQRITELEFELGQWGSHRAALDHNQVLVPDKLAFRFNGLYEREEYKVEEAYEKDRRGYLSVAYRPLPYTTIRASVEEGNIDSNRPEIRPPTDAYTHWWDIGRPVWDPSTGTWSRLGTLAPGYPDGILANGNLTGNYISTVIGAISGSQRQMLLVYNDPNSSQLNVGHPGFPDAQGMRGGNIFNAIPNQAGDALATTALYGLRERNAILNRVIHVDDITRNFWKATQITDPGIYDFYHHMLHGVDKREYVDWTTYNVTLEQLFLEGHAGFELSYNQEELDNGLAMPLDSTISGYTLRVDINSHLPDGTPNPNFGRPFVTAYSKSTVKSADRDVVRATGFYDLDLREVGSEWLGRTLGRHRFQVSHSRQKLTSFSENGNFYFNNGIDYVQAVRGEVTSASSASRGAIIMRYLGPDVSNSPEPVRGNFATPVSQMPLGVQSVNLLWYDEPETSDLAGQNEWTTRDFSLLQADLKNPEDVRRVNNVRYTREEVNSTVGILQSHWLNGSLVSTLGVRRDHVRTYDAGRPAEAPATGTAIIDENFRPELITNTTEDNFNWGVVLHSPEFINRHLPFNAEISLFYNQAENFRPAGQRYDIWDNPLPHEVGETEDYGIMLSLFEGKLVLRATEYETISALSSDLGNLTTPLNNLADFLSEVQREVIRGRNVFDPELEREWDPAASVAAWNEWYNSPTGLALRNTFRVTENVNTENPALSTTTSNRRTGEVVAPSDVRSTGQEFEIIYNPTRNWRIAFNANRAEAVRTNVAVELRNLVFDELVPLMQGPAGDLFADEDNDGIARDRFTNQIYNQMLPRLSEEGLPTNELREWHWNLVTNYSFTEGPFRGFNVGLGVRWQDEVAIGAPIIDHPIFGPAPDVTNPYYGPSETNVDAWVGYTRKFEHFDWRIQLNVRNIGVGNELIPVGAQPDGSIAGWRIAPTQSWTIRNTFSF